MKMKFARNILACCIGLAVSAYAEEIRPPQNDGDTNGSTFNESTGAWLTQSQQDIESAANEAVSIQESAESLGGMNILTRTWICSRTRAAMQQRP